MKRKRIALEVIATTAEDARIAEAAGADRIELICAQGEGGLTPSLGMVEQIVAQLTIPIHVMIRPHSRNFTYSQDDLDMMLRDVRYVARSGATALVLGVLDGHARIDEHALQRIIDAAQQQQSAIQITFHRAFDETTDLHESIHTLGQYPLITRILTSGGQPSVLEAVDEFPQLIQLADQHSLSLIAGAGLTLETLGDFVRRTGTREIHLGSAVRQQGNILFPLDADRIRQARHILDAYVE
ncbi:copper homeostasis protein CutC [Paenibacillus sp. SGZ-1009]|uniref:copper homeostasis protein CutC n=1 Tax=Paenibacillus campi TaxID=3106031 RepID=UPI002AFDE8B4|nr:copper homeostasis protein CutC [Paenibacillus sp. SGZ-1009]